MAHEIRGRVVIGTVQGDIHEIGKSLVATMLTANGFDVYDLGVNVKPEAFMDKVREVDATLLCLSALLTTTMMGQPRVIQALSEAGIRDRAQVLVGGAPVTQAWADEIGADGYAENAAGAVAVANKLLGSREAVENPSPT
jgi:methylmalonyl-CoA mutase cobalamin-binding domain/chain